MKEFKNKTNQQKQTNKQINKNPNKKTNQKTPKPTKKPQPNPTPAISDVSRDCSKAVSTALHLAVCPRSGLLAVPSLSDVPLARAGSQMPLPFFLEAISNMESGQAEKCHQHGGLKAAMKCCSGLGPGVAALWGAGGPIIRKKKRG